MNIDQKTIHEVKPNTFIFEKRNALALDICQEMIRRFEADTENQYQGRIGQTMAEDQSIKRSTDLVTSGKENWKDLDNELFRSLGLAIKEFREAYPFFKGPFKDNGYAIQRTNTGEFYHWHIDGGSHEFAQRQLVAVWYLNDVAGPGGETEFSYQQVKVKPEAGKLCLFPPFWTHEHRGAMLEKGIKYIATTWVVFA
jgi:Rps23 Pro-64 3,4-dihydroxylase Tpa1-like proline 4-hydroxylase